MKLTTYKVGKTLLKTKKEKIAYLLKRGVLKKRQQEDFVDEETGEVVTIKFTMIPKLLKHKELDKMIVNNFNAKVIYG